MARKKKVDIEDVMDEFGEEDLNDESVEDETREYEDLEKPDLFEDAPTNPMGLAYHINKESDTVKAFKDMPRETRFSFLDGVDKLEVKHHARAYRNWKYIEKIIELRVKEDKDRYKAKSNIKNIKDKETLREYFIQTNREYLLGVVDDLDIDDIKMIVEAVKAFKDNYMLETIEKKKEKMNVLYTDYVKENPTPSHIDDMDNMGKIVDTSIVSMGYKGNAASHSVMTIQAVKNEDIQKVAEEKSKFSLLDAIKRRFA